MYEWCGNPSFEYSGYEGGTEDSKNLSVPIFFSEYGFNEDEPREFTEVQTLCGENVIDVWSGGIVNMYFEEVNNYGLVTPDEHTIAISTLADFNSLKSELESMDPSPVTSSQVKTTSLACSTQESTWDVSTEFPPTAGQAVCDCLASSVKCVGSSDVYEDDHSTLYAIV